ncbi:MAG: hypothetical protein SGPRY_006954 [Prymnesium sp.]
MYREAQLARAEVKQLQSKAAEWESRASAAEERGARLERTGKKWQTIAAKHASEVTADSIHAEALRAFESRMQLLEKVRGKLHHYISIYMLMNTIIIFTTPT